MKGWIAIGLVALVVLVVAGLVTFAGGSSDQPNNGPHVVAVSGTASVSTAPDKATVTLGTRTQAANPADAQSGNAAKMNAVLKALYAQGVAKADIKTADISLDRQTQNRGTKRETTFYVAHNSVIVTMHDLTKVGAIVDAAVKGGADSVGNIQFSLSDQTKARQQALSEAVKGAHQKAEVMAQAADSSLGNVVSIREQGSSYPRPVQYGGASLATGAESTVPSPVVPPSNIETRVTVNVVWSLS